MVSGPGGESIEFEYKFGVIDKEILFGWCYIGIFEISAGSPHEFYNENSSRLRRVCYELGMEAFLL